MDVAAGQDRTERAFGSSTMHDSFAGRADSAYIPAGGADRDVIEHAERRWTWGATLEAIERARSTRRLAVGATVRQEGADRRAVEQHRSAAVERLQTLTLSMAHRVSMHAQVRRQLRNVIAAVELDGAWVDPPRGHSVPLNPATLSAAGSTPLSPVAAAQA